MKGYSLKLCNRTEWFNSLHKGMIATACQGLGLWLRTLHYLIIVAFVCACLLCGGAPSCIGIQDLALPIELKIGRKYKKCSLHGFNHRQDDIKITWCSGLCTSLWRRLNSFCSLTLKKPWKKLEKPWKKPFPTQILGGQGWRIRNVRPKKLIISQFPFWK